MDRARVLVIGVAEPLRQAFRSEARERGFEMLVAGAEVAPVAEGSDPDLCVVALRSGPELRERVRSVRKAVGACPLVALVSGGDAETGAELTREGVADVTGLSAAPARVVARALALLAPRAREPLAALVGRSRAMRRLRSRLRAVARARATVLVTGETGTGKGLVARTLHRMSPRPEAPFVHVDCAALAPSVIESELFGHERGAFTGAAARRSGRFELAGDGTIFLDEIADLAPPLQAKLLRVLQDREYERVGGTRTLPMRARVIAATSSDLRRAVAEGRFRSDLYYRLDVVRLHVPPLRERLADLPDLVREGLARAGPRLGLPAPSAPEELCDRLAGHTWPGNVRELLNVVERMVVARSGAPLEPGDEEGAFGELALPAPPIAAESPAAGYGLPGAGAPVAEAPRPVASDPGAGAPAPAGRHALVSALIEAGGNVSRAARRLGIPRSTLRYRIGRHGLEALIPRD